MGHGLARSACWKHKRAGRRPFNKALREGQGIILVIDQVVVVVKLFFDLITKSKFVVIQQQQQLQL